MLKIRDVTRYAADEYICRAQNTNGEAERRMRITVNCEYVNGDTRYRRCIQDRHNSVF